MATNGTWTDAVKAVLGEKAGEVGEVAIFNAADEVEMEFAPAHSCSDSPMGYSTLRDLERDSAILETSLKAFWTLIRVTYGASMVQAIRAAVKS